MPNSFETSLGLKALCLAVGAILLHEAYVNHRWQHEAESMSETLFQINSEREANGEDPIIFMIDPPGENPYSLLRFVHAGP